MAQEKSPKPIEVPIADIPLPPAELTEELDNSRQATPDPVKREAKPEVEKLDFVSEAETREAVHPLEHPFNWAGETVREICIRRLTVSEVGQVVADSGPDGIDYYDIYAAMTGLPASVLRGLMDDDGSAVTRMCQAFFPRAFRTDDD